MAKQYVVEIGLYHSGAGGRLYKKGEIVTSEQDLIADFPGKFILYTGPASPVVAAPTDVTSAFVGAEELFYKVFAVQGGFNVVEVDQPEKPLNPGGPKSAVEIQKFLDQQTENEPAKQPAV